MTYEDPILMEDLAGGYDTAMAYYKGYSLKYRTNIYENGTVFNCFIIVEYLFHNNEVDGIYKIIDSDLSLAKILNTFNELTCK